MLLKFTNFETINDLIVIDFEKIKIHVIKTSLIFLRNVFQNRILNILINYNDKI